MEGYIKIHRKITECWVWSEPEKAVAWIDLLMMANFKDTTLMIGGEMVEVKRGTFFTSEVKLAKKWHWSRDRVRRFLRTLVDTGMITTNKTAFGTAVSIVKYDFYQGVDTTDDTTNDTTNDTGNDTTDDTTDKTQKKNIKNVKNIYNPPIIPPTKRFKPPTVEEVREYCEERNNGVDPNTFVDFYSAKGWKIGTSPMKDWKASVRTWEKKDKQKQQGNPHQREEYVNVLGF